MVDENRVTGSGNQIKGSIKEGVGNLTGDEKLKNEGTMDKVKGKIENAVGSAKDTIKETFGSKDHNDKPV